ncbi:MAG: serine--tRNA ligase [Pseudomonas fluorescens]|nr:MAG: serine--tRNA ligase [Pseudomonas fluorescens]
MLDRRFVIENQDLIRENIARRQMNIDFDRFLELESQRRVIQKQIEDIRAQSNAVAKDRELSVDDKRARGTQLRQEEARIAAELEPVEAEAQAIFITIPNLTYEGSPNGGEDASAEIDFGTTPKREFTFKPKDHVELMEALNMVNFAAGAKVSGSGFYFLTGQGALLELALTRYALDIAMEEGFEPVLSPDLARDCLMQGAGFVPRGNESNTYHVEDSDLNLIATSEITLVGMSSDEILEKSALPVKLAGISHCFRSERSHGSATRGIYRVHQFTKTEMVVVCTEQQAVEMHMKLRAIEQRVFDGLGIPYRVLEIATGDLGASAYRKFDLEAWMPGRNGGSWGEITSTSNCTDFQARRLNIRYRDDDGKLKFAYTLNGTALSVCRAMIALVENHQQEDGSIVIPEALRPYMGKVAVISAKK